MEAPFEGAGEHGFSGEELQMAPFAGFGSSLVHSPQLSIQMSSNLGGGGGTFKSTQMSYQTYVDEAGKTHVKKMEKTNNRHVDGQGNVIEDHEEFYKDSGKNFNKIKKKRRLNDRGMQITKENRNGECNEYKQFYNMDEDDMGQFIEDWRDKGKRIAQRNPQLSLQAQEHRPKAIGYRDSREPQEAPKRRTRKRYVAREPREGTSRSERHVRRRQRNKQDN